MTATVISLPRKPAKSDAGNPAFKFTIPAIRKAVAEAEGQTNVVLRDEGCRGLILRKQRRDWTFAIEKKIRGKLWREALAPLDLATLNIADTRERASRVMADMASGTHTPRKERQADLTQRDGLAAMTLEGALARHAEVTNTRPSTATNYKYAVKLLAELAGRVPRVAELTTDMCRTAYRHGEAAGKASGTMALMLRALSSLWTIWAEDHPDGQRPASNPVQPLLTRRRGRKGLVKKPKPRTGVLLPAERKPWIEHCLAEMRTRGPVGSTYAAMAFIAVTGLRLTEATKLTWAEVEDEQIRIPGERMKAGEELARPITKTMRRILDHQKKFHPASPYVFPSWKGQGPLGDPRKTFALVNVEVLDEGRAVGSHDLRRTYIVAAELAGVPGIAARMLTAHATGDVHDDYARAIASELPRFAQMIEDALLSEPRT